MEVVWSMVVVAEAGTVAVGMVVEGKMSARQRQGVKQWQEKTKVELAGGAGRVVSVIVVAVDVKVGEGEVEVEGRNCGGGYGGGGGGRVGR